MSVDRYAKLVLTVIAACLLWISAGGPSVLTPVSAQDQPQRVVMAGWDDANGKVNMPNSGARGAFATNAMPLWVSNP